MTISWSSWATTSISAGIISMEVLVSKLFISSLNPSVCHAMLFFVVANGVLYETLIEENNIC
jgi:hypothetical protein